MGCLTMFGFINTLNNKKQNIEFGMKRIIAWWTGATSDWSGAIITNWMKSIVNIMIVARRFESCQSTCFRLINFKVLQEIIA